MTKVWNDINQSQFKVDLTHFDCLNIFGYSSEIQNRCELVMVYDIEEEFEVFIAFTMQLLSLQTDTVLQNMS